MAQLKINELKKMNKGDREKKLKELKLEMIKARIEASKTGSSKIKQTKKIIARILMLDKSEKEELGKKHKKN
jgi:ribosomal protein L29